MTPILQFERVIVTENDGPTALSWSLHDTGVYALAAGGASTAGLVRACVGVQAPVSGTVKVFGTEPYRLPRRARYRFSRRVAAWLLPPALLSNMPIRMSLLLPLLYDAAWSRSAAERRVAVVSELCELGSWVGARPGDVPADVRHRASLARALAGEPEVLVADDFAIRDHAGHAALARICRDHVPTVVFASSVPDRLVGLVDDIISVTSRTVEHA
jgi:ABC-type transporter Mla maintaining outer membrane lipid asymmetry ATPase subunit MlaF